MIVHEAEKKNVKRTQKIDIYLSYILNFELPWLQEEPAD
ncbi:MAG: hypothetical protein LBU32_00250 [Clostridiales bacterium]|nr:hypothetical protein [Clostridiales bacterium]